MSTDTATTATTDTQPTLVRYNRVEYFLRGHPATMADTTTKTYSKGVKTKVFSTAVWNVTGAISAAGVDSCTLNRAQVVAWADHVLSGAPMPDDQQATPEPTRTVAQAAIVPTTAKEPAIPDETETVVADTSVDVRVPLHVAIWQLLLGATDLIQNHDRSPGHRERLDAASTLARKYHSMCAVFNPPTAENASLSQENVQVVAETTPAVIPTPR